MGGGLMQLVAYGAQDIYLTGNPQITFFKVVYRRHTNFSLESIEQTFNGQADFGKKVSCTISRNGDLVHKIYLETSLPSITNATSYQYSRWVNYIGEALINYAEVEIGGQRIDRQYGEWMHIWNQISLPAGHEVGYNRIVGNVPQLIKNSGTYGANSQINGMKLFIPLQFWFCRNPGLALPLIALQYHEVKINIEFQELKDLLIHTNGSAVIQSPNGFSLSNTSLWVDYIFLDVDERRRFAQMSHEYLIEQLQYPGEETITTQSNKIRLNFNHPVKEIIWVAQKNQNITYKQWYNYTDRLDSTPTTANGTFGSNLMYSIAENMQDASGSALRLINEDQGENTCALAKIQLNGQDRFAERPGDYFTYVQSLNHHTRTPAPGINIYSFGLKPEEHQPSGTCNFSRIDNANLFITVTADTVKKGTVSLSTSGVLSESSPSSGTADNAKVRIYCTNYNVLRIMSGMGGLAYSN